jgi:hypothetical protein
MARFDTVVFTAFYDRLILSTDKTGMWAGDGTGY